MRALWSLLTSISVCGCTTALGEDFQGYVAQPTECDPADPQGGSPRQFVECAEGQSCFLGLNADGTADTADPNHTACFAVEDSLPQGTSCSYDNDCGVGGFCSDVVGCAVFCAVGSTCSGGSPCVAFSPQVQVASTTLGFCAPSCNPSTQPSCAGSCSFVTDTDTVCIAAGSGVLGASCTSDTDCAKGLGCDDAAQHCSRYCRAGSNDCGAKACNTAGEPPLSYDGQTYGYCAL